MLHADLISSIKDNGFDQVALQIYRFQSQENPVYKKFHDLLGIDPEHINSLEEIPFMPVTFFKHNVVKTGQWQSQKEFHSSTTTGSDPSIHYVKDIHLYEHITQHCIYSSIGVNVKDYTWIGLLPSYLERQNASLVHMVDYFMRSSSQKEKYFYLFDHDKLFKQLKQLKEKGEKTILMGVTFALMDFAEKYEISMDHLTIIETGGMKGRAREPLRNEIHDLLKKKLSPHAIGSEYGMTEMMSQAYMLNNEYYNAPSTVRIYPRDITDPLKEGKYGKSACLNIIDLGNIHSCSFLATDDVGIVKTNRQFKVMGRLETSEIRGCSLMYTGS